MVKEGAAIGMIPGGLNTQTTINHCFWVTNESIGKPYGFMLISEPIVKDSYLIQSNETTLKALNNWASANGHTEWMPLYQNGGLIGSASNEMVIVMRAAFPDLMRDSHNFEWLVHRQQLHRLVPQ